MNRQGWGSSGPARSTHSARKGLDSGLGWEWPRGTSLSVGCPDAGKGAKGTLRGWCHKELGTSKKEAV